MPAAGKPGGAGAALRKSSGFYQPRSFFGVHVGQPLATS
jgi:hypothetical protein